MSWWGAGCRTGSVRSWGEVARGFGVLAGAALAVSVTIAGCAAAEGDGAPSPPSVDPSMDAGTQVRAESGSDADGGLDRTGTTAPDPATSGPVGSGPVTSGPVTSAAATSVPLSSDQAVAESVTSGSVQGANDDLSVPPRVGFPDDPDRQAVVDAAYAFFDAARAAQADPGNTSLRSRLAATMTEPIASRMTAFLDGLVIDGVRIIANESSPTYLQVFAPSVSQSAGSGLVDVCAVDSDVRIDASTGEILDDDVVSGVQTLKLRRVGGVWLLADLEGINRYEGQVGCV